MLRAALLAVVALVCAACGADEPAPLAPRPGARLVLVSLDTLRADRLGCYGYERPTSPHLDALSEEALRFAQAHATASTTAPSHMTMFTGLLHEVHGIMNRTRGEGLSPAIPTLSEVLREHGYATAAFADGGLLDASFGFARGFDHFESRLEPFDTKLDRVQAWLEDAPEGPAFLFLHTYAVHAPYVPGTEHDLFTDPDYAGPLDARVRLAASRLDRPETSDLRALMDMFWAERGSFTDADRRHLSDLYDGCVHRADAGIGRLLDMLEAHGWLDDAWVVITSDHGEAFGEHGSLQHRQVYQEELAVPLLVRPPGGLDGPRVEQAPVSHRSLAPTLLAALDLPLPATMAGPLLPPFDEAPGAGPDGRPLFAAGGEGLAQRAVRRDVHKLIVDDGGPEAYDLGSDPAETSNLAQGSPPPWLTELLELLEDRARDDARLRARLGEPIPTEGLDEADLETLRALGYLR